MPEAKLAQVRRPVDESAAARIPAQPAGPGAGYNPNQIPPQQMQPPVQQAAPEKKSLLSVLAIALGLCFVALIVTSIIAISSRSKLNELNRSGRSGSSNNSYQETDDSNSEYNPDDSEDGQHPKPKDVLSAEDFAEQFYLKNPIFFEYSFQVDEEPPMDDSYVQERYSEGLDGYVVSEANNPEKDRYQTFSVKWQIRDTLSSEGPTAGDYSPTLDASVAIEELQNDSKIEIPNVISVSTVGFRLKPSLTFTNYLGVSSETATSASWRYSIDGEYKELSGEKTTETIVGYTFTFSVDETGALTIAFPVTEENEKTAVEALETLEKQLRLQCSMELTDGNARIAATVKEIVLPGYSPKSAANEDETPPESTIGETQNP
jgi:hypothetical protein